MKTLMREPKHNHEWIASVDGGIYHPDCDPRILQDTCPACKKLMTEWAIKIDDLINSGV